MSRTTRERPLAGKVALVTGGSRGIGAAIAKRLAGDGASVAVTYSKGADAASSLVKEIERGGGKAIAIQADAADADAVRNAVERTVTTLGRLDVLVNNAGVMTRGPFLDVPVPDYGGMFAVNVTGTLLCTQHALRPMLAARYGRIINLSSQLARTSVGAGFAAYAATKGAIEAFTRATAHEVGPHGVTVNAIAPGGIDTDMSRAVMTPEYRARRLGELPVRHFGGVEDVAYCAVFLATEEAHYLTGQVLQPNGGWVMP